MSSKIEQLNEFIRRLPDDFTIEDILYEVEGLVGEWEADEQIERGQFITHAELEERVRGWRKSSGQHALPRTSNE